MAMTGDEARRPKMRKEAGSPPHRPSRPKITSQQSSSLPATPKQYARRLSRPSRSPSPQDLTRTQSPRSASSDKTRAHAASFQLTNASCRFQTTQTSRRRIPYTIGSDMLESAKPEPLKNLDKDSEKKLNDEIRRLYKGLLPAHDSQQRRRQVVDKLRKILKEEWPSKDPEVYIFGSSGNELCTSKSDVDVCISLKDFGTVCALAELLAKRGMKEVRCVHAKAVPIVKIFDPKLQMACDLNVNNHIAVKNTRMVRAYMEIDDRARSLAMVVKFWAKQRILGEASGGTLSSYTWTLLVINFLQTRATPVLPLISLRDENGNVRGDFSEDIKRFEGFGKSNTESLAELLFHFFRRYGHEVDYNTAVMSVRQGKLMSKAEKGWERTNNNRLCVEEPFNTDRNLGNTADDYAFRGLHLEIRRAFTALANSEDLESQVCEAFEFPKEEPRPAIERPQNQTKLPTISRSASQSGRGNRYGGTGRGSRRPLDPRNGPSGRRSSSAAAFGHNPQPFPQGPAVMYPDYFTAHAQQQLSPDELNRLQQRMSEQVKDLQSRQAWLSQLEQQQRGQHQMPNYTGGHGPPRGTASPLSTPRTGLNGFPSPQLSGADMIPPSSAPLYQYGFPVTSQQESPVSMSHSSSQQGTNTNPSSPMLPAATPHRRGFQRAQPVGSPGAALRSQSQPARSMPPQYAHLSGTRSVYGAPGYIVMKPVQYAQMNGTATMPGYPMPYLGPNGVWYAPVPISSLPREYAGYGINDGSFAALPIDPNIISPVQRPFEEMSSQETLTSPTEPATGLEETAYGQVRSPSPHQFTNELENDGTSTPLRADFSRYRRSSPGPLRQALEESAPLIVNGSTSSSTQSIGRNDRAKSVSGDSLGTSTSTPADSRNATDGSVRSSISRSEDGHSVGQPPVIAPRGTATPIDRRRTIVFGSRELSNSFDTMDDKAAMPPPPKPVKQPETQSSTKTSKSSEPQIPPVRAAEQQQQKKASSQTLQQPPVRSPPDSARPSSSSSASRKSPELANGMRRNVGGGRTQPAIPHLDLAMPAVSTPVRSSETSSATRAGNSKVLSPVQETRTPSPIAHRKMGSGYRDSVLSNGTNPGSGLSVSQRGSSALANGSDGKPITASSSTTIKAPSHGASASASKVPTLPTPWPSRSSSNPSTSPGAPTGKENNPNASTDPRRASMTSPPTANKPLQPSSTTAAPSASQQQQQQHQPQSGPALQSSNPWQQAGSRKGGRRGAARRSQSLGGRGEVMPERVEERKGG